MILRKAHCEEVNECYGFINEARVYQSELGFTQWGPDYPTLQIITDDIAAGIGYVFSDESELLGYCCIIFGDEPAYKNIEGSWNTENEYAVVHRMAFGKHKRGKGLSKEVFSLIKNLCLSKEIHTIRVDTQDENKVMKHILQREGFVYCGIIKYDGGPKLAYELDM